MRLLVFIGLIAGFFSCSNTQESKPVLNSAPVVPYLSAPEGFSVHVYAEGVTNARQMAMSPNGILYVGSRRKGVVHAVIDRNNDYQADTVLIIAENLRLPNGVAWKDGDLYVAEVSKIWKFPDIDDNLDQPTPELVSDDFPTDGNHGWKYIAFGPDDKLYVPVGAPCNICNKEEENPIYASLTRMDADGTNREIIAHGIRNTVGFTWHPETGNLWFTDNGRDWMGDDIPPCELNELTKPGQHFGYPYLHGNDIWDPEFGEEGMKKQEQFTRPVQELGPHVAPLGVLFYHGQQFPDQYKNQALIAEHGSWNRENKIGYRIMMVTFDENGNATSYEPFIDGWLQADEEVKGRPVALLQLDDGSVLISDDLSGTIYRVVYTG
ncbi:MAG: sorbosone dehydrogenase family protein [Bacteroidota bacterium]